MQGYVYYTHTHIDHHTIIKARTEAAHRLSSLTAIIKEYFIGNHIARIIKIIAATKTLMISVIITVMK